MLGGAAGEDGRAESLAARRWGAAARRESREEEGAACWWCRPTARWGEAAGAGALANELEEARVREGAREREGQRGGRSSS